jgi:hypothetical protein
MTAHLKGEQRRAAAAKAYDLWVQRIPFHEIGERCAPTCLAVSPRLARTSSPGGLSLHQGGVLAMLRGLRGRNLYA